MNPVEWAACVTRLRVAYPRDFAALLPEDLGIWFEMLEDLDGDAVIGAVKHMAKTQRAFPSIADIRELAEVGREDAGAAWAKACAFVSALSLGQVMRDGVLQPLPVMSDPAIAAAIEAVGREAIRHRTPDSEGTCRAHFAKAYKAAQDRAKRAEAGLPSGGIRDALTAAQGGKVAMLAQTASPTIEIDAMVSRVVRVM